MTSVIDEWIQKYEDSQKKIYELEVEIIKLKAHLSRSKNPNYPNYTDEELDAMFLIKENK